MMLILVLVLGSLDLVVILVLEGLVLELVLVGLVFVNITTTAGSLFALPKVIHVNPCPWKPRSWLILEGLVLVLVLVGL